MNTDSISRKEKFRILGKEISFTPSYNQTVKEKSKAWGMYIIFWLGSIVLIFGEEFGIC